MIGWKFALLLTFVMFYLGFGIISYFSDLFAGRAIGPDFASYLTFGKFKSYNDAFVTRSADFFTSDGVLRADALVSMLFLGVAQLGFIGIIALTIWTILPTNKKWYGALSFFIALVFTSVLMWYATGDPVLGVFKFFYWGLTGGPPTVSMSG